MREVEKRPVLFEKPLGLNRPAVAGLPVRGLESLWDRLGAASMEDGVFPMTAVGCVGASVGGLETDYYADIETSMPQSRPGVSNR